MEILHISPGIFHIFCSFGKRISAKYSPRKYALIFSFYGIFIKIPYIWQAHFCKVLAEEICYDIFILWHFYQNTVHMASAFLQSTRRGNMLWYFHFMVFLSKYRTYGKRISAKYSPRKYALIFSFYGIFIKIPYIFPMLDHTYFPFPFPYIFPIHLAGNFSHFLQFW